MWGKLFLKMRTKQEILEYNRQWNKKNPEKVKRYREKRREKSNLYNKKYRTERLKSWEDFVPQKTQCQICGANIYYNTGYFKRAIHFDHRNNGKEIIEKNPTIWLRNHKRTSENEKIWKSCDFGFLCWNCNRYLPTKNRLSFFIKASRYIFGERFYQFLIDKIIDEELNARTINRK